MLSPAQHQDFIDKGYLVVKELVPLDLLYPVLDFLEVYNGDFDGPSCITARVGVFLIMF